ncbi:MAG: hypothetical protein V1808_01315, partial [Candidatus Daviesbacteria bacterium]
NDEVENGEKRVDVLWDLAGRKKQYKVLAYPYGLYNGQLIQYLQDLKYDAVFSIRPVTYHTLDDLYILGRKRMS